MFYYLQSGFRNPKYICAALIVFSSSISFGQVKSNLEIFYSLARSSAKDMTAELGAASSVINLELNTGNSYSIFNSQIISAINEEDKKILLNNENPKVIFAIDKAEVKYGEMFRDGFLGDYLVQRSILLEGNYFISGENQAIRKVTKIYRDTISVEDINEVENFSFPFTRGEIPAEPFFSGLFEPIAAIGTAALAVILFFTIRSK